MEKSFETDLLRFLKISKAELDEFIGTMDADTYQQAAALIRKTRQQGGRIHITGIGKPAHVANYMASLMSSVGIPTYFLHGTEAVHGSCGQLVAGDVVICISNSGETLELKSTVLAIQNNGCRIIAVTGNLDSWLAKQADIVLYAGVKEEGGPLNRAPRVSVLAEMLTLQALSVVLQSQVGWTPEEYVRCHPGGKLGVLRNDEVEHAKK